MCIIIDVNTLPSVFDKKTLDHNDFEPVKEWILTGEGKIIFGGTQYSSELGRMERYLSLVNELKKKHKAFHINDMMIDDEQKKITKKCQKLGFDDSHIIAIVIVSRCHLVCTKDKRSHEYIKNPIFYKGTCKIPLIYGNKKHRNLLIKKNIFVPQNCL